MLTKKIQDKVPPIVYHILTYDLLDATYFDWPPRTSIQGLKTFLLKEPADASKLVSRVALCDHRCL